MNFNRSFFLKVGDRITKHPAVSIIVLLLCAMILAVLVRTGQTSQWLERYNVNDKPALVGNDGYYYLRLARDIQQNRYVESDEMRQSGNTAKRPFPKPLLPVLTVLISDTFGISLEKTAVWLSPLLAGLIVPVIFLLSRALGMGVIAALMSSILSAVAVTFVERSVFGYYDTDVMNLIFVFLISYFLLGFARIQSVKRYLHFSGAGATFFLFLLWWEQALFVVMGTFFVPFVIALCFYVKKPTNIRYFFAVLAVFVGMFVWYILTDNIGLIQNIERLYGSVMNQNNALFPTIINEIAETKPLTFGQLTDATLNSGYLVIIALFGLGYLIYLNPYNALFLVVPAVLGILPLFLGQRFAMFTEMILVIGIGFFIEAFFWAVRKMSPGGTGIKRAGVLAVLAVVLYSFDLYKQNVKKNYVPTVGNVIESALQIKKTTPENAVIWANMNSGYPLTYYSERAAIMDGSHALQLERHVYQAIPLAAHSQTLSSNFIKFYVTHDQVGMRTIYDLFGNADTGLKFLKKVLALKPDEAEGFINQEVTFNEEIKNTRQLLAFLYPAPPRPVYLLINPAIADHYFYRNGSWDIKERKGTESVYLNYFGVYQTGEIIVGSNNLVISLKYGWKGEIFSSTMKERTDSLAHIFTLNEQGESIINFAGGNIAFEWIKPARFGVLMNIEAVESTLNQLYVRYAYETGYFRPVSLNSPNFQIWLVEGDVYPPS